MAILEVLRFSIFFPSGGYKPAAVPIIHRLPRRPLRRLGIVWRVGSGHDVKAVEGMSLQAHLWMATQAFFTPHCILLLGLVVARRRIVRFGLSALGSNLSALWLMSAMHAADPFPAKHDPQYLLAFILAGWLPGVFVSIWMIAVFVHIWHYRAWLFRKIA